MVSSIGSAGASRALIQRNLEALDRPQNEPGLTAAGDALGRPTDSLDLSPAYRQRESLRIRSRTQVKVNEDGDLVAKSRTTLRYRYDFQSADGARISIRLKANVKFKQTVQGDESSQSLRLSFKASIRTIQQDAAATSNSLQAAPEIPAAIGDTISRALELFNELTDAAVNQFEQSDPLEGDPLIASVVDAYNGFAGTILENVEPPSEPNAEVVPEGPVEEPVVQALPEAPVVIEPVEPTPDQIAPVSNEAQPERVESEADDAEVDDVDDVDDDDDERVTIQPADNDDRTTAETAAVDQPDQASQTASAALFKLRFRIVQSLTTITGGPDSDSGTTISRSVLRASAELSIRSRGDRPSFDDALVPRLGFDSQG